VEGTNDRAPWPGGEGARGCGGVWIGIALETGGADVVQVDRGWRGRSAGSRIRLWTTLHVPRPGDREAGDYCGDGDESDTESTNGDLPWWRRDIEMLPGESIGRMHAPLEARAAAIRERGALPARGDASTFSAAKPMDRKGSEMSERKRVTMDPAFEVEIPEGWEAEADEEGGVNLAGEAGVGLLHLIAFPQEPDEILDPGEELYIFLEEQGVELAEDEIEDVELPDGAELALCEYTAEEEGEDDPEGGTYWMVGVAAAPGKLVFCNYSCPADESDAEREAVVGILRTLKLK
jgi:hypothetical protein